MERDSFIFYRTYYEAISSLPKDIKLEVFTAIVEYALYGKLPEGMKPFARGMFTLIRSNIDASNTRFENGSKGAQYGKLGGRPKKQPASTEPTPAYGLTYEQEVERMRNDSSLRDSICTSFGITAEEYEQRLLRFLARCIEDKERKGRLRHESFDDCVSHLRFWMLKAYACAPAKSNQQPDYTYNGGFGSIDQ